MTRRQINQMSLKFDSRSNNESFARQTVAAFAAQLEQTCGMPVILWDERRTTIAAHNILSQQNYHGKKRKNTVDAVAASLILEGYLSYLRLNRE